MYDIRQKRILNWNLTKSRLVITYCSVVKSLRVYAQGTTVSLSCSVQNDWTNEMDVMKRDFSLTHWGRATHKCVSKLTIVGSDNGLSPGRHQTIIWTNPGISLIEPLGTNFSEIFIGIQIFSFKKMHLKMSSAKWRPFCPSLHVLRCISGGYYLLQQPPSHTDHCSYDAEGQMRTLYFTRRYCGSNFLIIMRPANGRRR